MGPESYLVAVRQEATLLHVAHKATEWQVVHHKFKVVQFLNGLAELFHLQRASQESDKASSSIGVGQSFLTSALLIFGAG